MVAGFSLNDLSKYARQLILGNGANETSSSGSTNGTSSINNSNDVSVMTNFLSGLSGSSSSNSASQIGDSFTSTTAASGASEELKAELDELTSKRDANYQEIDKVQTEIQELINKAKQKIQEAKKDKDNEISEYKEDSDKVVEEQMRKYVEANKNGEGMSKDELNENIKNALPNVPGLQEALAAMSESGGLLDEVDTKVGNLKKLITDTQTLENEIKDKTEEYEAAKKAEEAAQRSSGCCDPIGFELDGETYDFIIDDGNFDSTSDLLGAEDQWAAMEKLDTNGDNIVDIEELKAGNIKAAKGDGSVVDLEETFGSDFSIDLKSYEKGGSHSAVDTTSDDDNDGTANQELLGTYNVNVGGKTVKGYNTNDDKEWLTNKFGISDDTSTNTSSTNKNNSNPGMELNEKLQAAWNNADAFAEESAELKGEAETETENISETKNEASAKRNEGNFLSEYNLTEKTSKTEEEKKKEEEEKKKEQEQQAA